MTAPAARLPDRQGQTGCRRGPCDGDGPEGTSGGRAGMVPQEDLSSESAAEDRVSPTRWVGRTMPEGRPKQGFPAAYTSPHPRGVDKTE